MCLYSAGNPRDLDYLAYLEDTCAKLVTQHKEITAPQSSIPNLSTELGSLKNELHVLASEHKHTTTSRAALKASVRDLRTELHTVGHELAADPSSRSSKPAVGCATRV